MEEAEDGLGEEQGKDREEGVVLGLNVSGACGNTASPKCTVGLNLKYALFIQLFFPSFSLASFSGIKRL